MSGGNIPSLEGVRLCRVATIPFSMVSQLLPQIYASREAGMDVSLVTSGGHELQQIEYSDRLRHHIIPIERSITPQKDLLSLVRLYFYFRKMRFNIVHSITPKAGLLSAMAAKLAGVPIRLHTFTGQPWVTRKGPVRWLARWSDMLVGRLNTRCYADSKSQMQFLLDEKVLSPDRSGVIGDGCLAGVDLQRFNADRWSDKDKAALRHELDIAPEARVVIFIGRINRDKGVMELLDAFRGLLAEDPQAILLMVGPSDADIGGEQAASWYNGPGKGLRHIGYTEEVEKYLAISDVLCLPSYREGFGTVIIEAAAMGIPAVGTRIYGLTDAVVDGRTGLLVTPKNRAELQKALYKMVTQSEMRQKMGEAARLHAQRFRQERVNRKMLEAYKNLCKRSVLSKGK